MKKRLKKKKLQLLKLLENIIIRKKICQGTETYLKSNVKYRTNWMSSNRIWDLIKAMNSRSSIKSLPIFNYINLYSVLEWNEIGEYDFTASKFKETCRIMITYLFLKTY